MSQYTASIQQLYVAYFGRPADAGGLAFWEGVVAAAGGKTAAISAAFAASNEYTTAYAGKSAVETVNQVYVNLFGHDADPSGLLFWANALQNKLITIDNVVTAIAAGAQGTDKVAYDSKVAAATAFTAALDTTAEILGYNTAAIPAAKTFIAGVTDEATLASAVAGVDAAVTTVVAAGTPVIPPQNFSLTTAVNTFTGGAGEDTFTADNTSTAQFSASDTLDGGAGSDTLTIYGSFGGTVGKLSNIEHVTLDSIADTGAWNLSTAKGVTDVNISRAVGGSTVTVASGVDVTLYANADATKTTNVAFSATQTAAKITVDTAVGTLNVTGAAVETLTVNATGAKTTLAALNTAAATTTIAVTGTQDLTVTAALDVEVTKVDASTFTGKLNVTGGAVTDDGTSAVDLTLIGGAGNDTLSIVGVGVGVETSVNGGAGDDTIKVSAAQIAADAGDVLNGGAGTDTLSVNFLDDATGAGLLATDLSASVTGFESITLTSDATATRTHTWAEGTVKSGVTSFTVSSADATDTFALTGLKAASTVKISTNEAAVSATIGTDTTADVLSVVLDGTTTGTLTATNYETVNVASNKDSSDNTNALTTVTASSAKTVNLTGSGALVGGTITLASAATFNAAGYSGNLTAAVFGDTVKSYVGGSGKDEISLVAGDLKQGNTFAGGAGTDKLTVTATAAQDMGILGLTGFETVNLTTNGANVADFRNVTDLATLNVSATAGTDDLTLNRLASTTQVTFQTAIDQVVTTINTGTTQKVGFDANVAVASLTLDSGTTTLTVNSDDGDATANENMGSFTAISGTSLATINVTGADKLGLGTLSSTVTKVDASAATGALTVTASGTATSIIGSQAGDSITGGAGADTIEGGKGNDTISGGAGHDTIVFGASGAANGTDVLTVTFGAGASSDILSFKNFLSTGSVDQNGGAGTAIVAYNSSAVTDVNIAGKVVTLADATGGGVITAVDTADEIAALIQGSGDVFALTAGGKAVIIAGESTGAAGAIIYFVDDSLDGVSGTVSATDVTIVGTIAAATDIDAVLASNITFA